MHAAPPLRPSLRLLAALAFAFAALLASAAPAEARTRTFCGVVKRACGGHLQPVCTSGAACDAGHTRYSGSPFPITIDCPWPISDVRVTGGCYDERPDCGDCSARGQIPCPQETAQWCTPGCDSGLFEQFGLCSDGTISFPDAGPNESCAPLLGLDCEPGLQCTAALTCSHEPAREGETCDVSAPCGPGLYCQAGIPQVCKRKRTVGEGCSAFKPCAEGLSCEACFTDKCQAPLQCFPNANEGAITEQQCRTLYSPVIADGITGGDFTLTWAGGNGASAVVSESQAFGVAYGQNGEYGCFTSFCFGVNSDVEITGAFSSVGFSTDFDSVDGKSFVVTEAAQTPFSLLSFSTSQSFDRLSEDGVFPPVLGALTGTEDALAVGGGLNPLPITAGTLYCDTVLDPVSVDPGQNETPPLLLPPLEYVVNGDFETDLYGWTCTNGGSCGWSWDSPQGESNPGSGRVRSPLAGDTLGGMNSSCVKVQEGLPYEPSAWLRTTGSVQGSASIRWSEQEDCSDYFMGEPIGSSPPDGVWRRVSAELTAPEGARSAWLRAIAIRDFDTGQLGTTWIDRAYIPEPGSAATGAAAAATLASLARRRRRIRR
jgi:hypothetical protein